jgi:undecaprenyl-diphosphatase
VWHERSNLGRWATSAQGWWLALLLVIGTIATAAVALPLRSLAVGAFTRLTWIGAFLLITGGVVLATRSLPGGPSAEGTTRWRQALIVGLAQGCAIFPGLSRSGLTIAASLGAGLDRRWAARFSFLLSIPAIAGVTLAEIIGARGELAVEGSSFLLACVLGLAAAAVSGYLALRLVIRTVSSRSFHRFAWYCLALGAVVVVMGLRGLG